MRLLTVSHYFESHRGGVELVAGQLIRQMNALGTNVVWLAADASPAPADLDCIPVKASNFAERRLGVPFPIPLPGAIRRIVRAVREADAVMLHDALYLTNVVAALAAKALGRPILIVQHIGAVPYRSPWLRGLMTLANALVARPMLASADQVAFISEITSRHFAGVRFRRPPQLVFNGVDPERFRPAKNDERAAARARFGLDTEATVVLFVGRFVEKKGLGYLEAAARTRPDLSFVFAGWGPIDPRAWGLANATVIEGLDHAGLAELYRGADVLALPSAGEGFPLVVQEALASGLPVICGAETVEADPAAAAWLEGVELRGLDGLQGVAKALCAAVDARPCGDAAARAAFARGRYAWDASARRYVALLQALRGGPAPEPVGPARATP